MRVARVVRMLGNIEPADIVILTELTARAIADAHRYVEKGHAKGKIIMKIR